MNDQLYSVSARVLKVGNNIRLGDDHYSRVLSIRPEEGHLIVGGPFNKTATALRVHTLDGNDFLVHPGQLIGVRRDTAPSKSDNAQWLNAMKASHCGEFGV